MSKSTRSLEVGAGTGGPWLQMGQRLRNRRIQVGFRKGAIAAHLGVSTTRFEEMEAGQAEISPMLLGRLSDLLKVPVSYFFEDIFAGAAAAQPAVSDQERLNDLVSAYRVLDSNKQQYLLVLARALAQDASETRSAAE